MKKFSDYLKENEVVSEAKDSIFYNNMSKLLHNLDVIANEVDKRLKDLDKIDLKFPQKQKELKAQLRNVIDNINELEKMYKSF